MRRLRRLLVLCTPLLLAGLPALAGDPVGEAYDRGAALRDRGDQAGALAEFKKGLEAAPDAPLLLFAAGLAAYEGGDDRASTDYFGRWRAVNPKAWRALTGLVRAHERLGDTAARDEARAALLALRAAGEDPELAKETVWWRDRFVVGPWWVMVWEHFEPTPDKGVRIGFVTTRGEHGEREPFLVTYGSHPKTTAALRAEGKLPPDGRVYHVDQAGGGVFHATWALWTQEPSYDLVRSVVREGLEERLRGEGAGVAPVESPR